MQEEGMGNCSTGGPPAGVDRPTPPSFAIPTTAPAFYVDGTHGSDDNSGTLQHPVQSVRKGVELARASPASAVHVVLRAGIHALAAPLALGPADSGLVLQNYPAEEVWLSGAQEIEPAAWEKWLPPSSTPAGATCQEACADAGHCCTGDVSSWQTPSCAMGCTIAAALPTVAECMAECDACNRKVSCSFKNHTFNLAGSCPAGCDASDGVSECYEGCKFQDKIPLDNTYKTHFSARAAHAANAGGGGGGVWGFHVLNDDDPWHTMQTLARYPNKDGSNSGSRELRWASIGPNATWTSAEPVHDLGDQIVVNATGEIPKNVTVFPDYYVYGANGACARAG